MRRAAPVLLVALLAAIALPPASPAAADPVDRALAFLAAQQGAHGGVADPWLSSWTALALAAAEGDGHAWSAGGASLADYLAAHDAGYRASSPAPLEAARAVLAVVALGDDPRAFNGTDHVARLSVHHDGRQFGSAAAVNDDIWAIWALRAAGEPASDARVQSAASFVLAAQRPDGSWGYAVSAPADADTTAWALMALAAAGRTAAPAEAAAVDRALTYLGTLREGDAFRQCLGLPSCGGPNAESTAAVLSAMKVLGRPGAAQVAGGLLAFQRDDGAFVKERGSPSWSFATPQAILALAGDRGYPPAARFETDARAQPPQVASGEASMLVAAADRCLWTDGARTAEGCRAALSWPTPGARTVVLRAWASAGGYVRETIAVEVRNAPPVAQLAAPAVAAKRAAVAFDALASADVDGRIVAWRFDFGDGGDAAWSTSPLASHAYARSGDYRVRLDVRDDAGAEATTQAAVRVVNAAPSVTIETPAACRPGVPLRLVAHVADEDPFAARWHAGEAVVEGTVLERAWPEGTWTARLVAVDEEGAVGEAALVLACARDAPPATPPAPAVVAPPPRPPRVTLDPLPRATAGAAVPIAGAIEDDEPGARVQLLLDGVGLPAEVEAGRFLARTPPLSAGRHEIVARAVDADGLASPLAQATLTVAAPPTTTTTTPPEDPVRAAPAAGLLLGALAASVPALLRRSRR